MKLLVSNGLLKGIIVSSASVRLIIGLLFIGLCQCIVSGPLTHPQKLPPTQVREHLFQLNDRFYSGDSPITAADFEALRQLGVTSIISVDGAEPERERAAEYGMTYMHWPVRYSAVTPEAALGIAQWVQKQPGIVYLHCHHGKHRGPAAAACVMLALDPTFTRQDAQNWLAIAGTDPRYEGLIELPWTTPRPTLAQLQASQNAKPQFSDNGMTATMVAVDERFDLLKTESATPNDAVILCELFHEAGRLPTPFAGEYAEPEALAQQLETALREKSLPKIERLRSQLSTQCTDCHARHRD